MVLSMTGFGQASATFGEKKIQVEIKSLNGKTVDVRMRVPSYFKDRELTLRKLILDNALRGKLEVNITTESEFGADEQSINKKLFLSYSQELIDLYKELNVPTGDIGQTVMRIPNVMSPATSEMSEEEWLTIKSTALEAVKSLNAFRAEEGESAHADLQKSSDNILLHLQGVSPYEKRRISRVKERIAKSMDEFFKSEKMDKNRFEQELLYYLEKLDINEEKVRLSQHCKFFNELLSNDNVLKGKKLSFIAQEMGREINTLGAKAQDSDIQQLVVAMKDELEQIKEQVANIV